MLILTELHRLKLSCRVIIIWRLLSATLFQKRRHLLFLIILFPAAFHNLVVGVVISLLIRSRTFAAVTPDNLWLEIAVIYGIFTSFI